MWLHTPTKQEIAYRLGVPVSKLTSIVKAAQSTISMDTPASSDEDATKLSDFIVDESTISDTLLALLLAGKESCCTRSTLSDGNLFDHSEVEVQQPAEPEQPAVNQPAEEHKSEDENSGRKKDTNQKKKNKNSTFDRLVKKLFGEEENTTDQ